MYSLSDCKSINSDNKHGKSTHKYLSVVTKRFLIRKYGE